MLPFDRERSLSAYRPEGMLDPKDLEPLPPTPISKNARRKLLSWGLSTEDIEQLRAICSNFRYDRCFDKVEYLTNTPLEVRKIDSYEEIAFKFPLFYDLEGRFFGQCGDIAYRFAKLMELGGYVPDLNDSGKLATGYSIAPYFCSGLSKTHFHMDGSSHSWNELVLRDDQGQSVDVVLVDAAFQKIETPEESGYTKKGMIDHVSLKYSLNAKCRVGFTIYLDGEWKPVYAYHRYILGISNDWKYAYGLGFARGRNGILTDVPKTDIFPVLFRSDAKAMSNSFFYAPESTRLIASIDRLSGKEEAEIRGILDVAQNFMYREQPSNSRERS